MYLVMTLDKENEDLDLNKIPRATIIKTNNGHLICIKLNKDKE